MPPKRKSAVSSTPASKKPKVSPIVTLGRAALKARGNGETLSEDEVSALAAYTQHLETQVEAYQKTENFLNRKGGKELSRAEIEADAERLKGNIERGIEKLMKWRPSCKTGSATFAFEGICGTPAIMANFLGLDRPEDVMNFKMKRYTHEDFEQNVLHDTIRSTVRYCSLYLTGNVNLYWNWETGEYKFSGRYGQLGTGKAAKASTEVVIPDPPTAA